MVLSCSAATVDGYPTGVCVGGEGSHSDASKVVLSVQGVIITCIRLY